MRLTVAVLLLATAIGAEELSSRSKQRSAEDAKAQKRSREKNTGVEKRAPLQPTAVPSSSPGIEYADSKNYLANKSPVHQIYATPTPPAVAKFSDVLTGQGHSFPAAIASHLYSPFSIYQARLASPTTYEVSAPIPSQLAYAEKISYQPVQFNPQVQYNQPKPNFVTPDSPIQTVYQETVQPIPQQQIPVQQVLYAQQPVQYQIPQAQNSPYQNALYQNFRFQNAQYHNPQYQNTQYQHSQFQNPQAIYALVQQRLAQASQTIQPGVGVTYTRQEESGKNQPIQREHKTAAKPEQLKVLEKQTAAPEKKYNAQTQGAVSYASFSQEQQPASYQPQHQQVQPQYQIQAQQQYQPETQQYQTQAQEQYQPQIQVQPQYQLQTQYQDQDQPQYIIQTQPHYQTQTQYQTQNHPQYVAVPNDVGPTKTTINGRQLFIRPVAQPVYQHQVYQGQEVAQQNQGLVGHPPVSPTFPPVQYFGKFAHDIFG